MANSIDREACEFCDFEWDTVFPAEVGPRLRHAVRTFANLLIANPEESLQRPNPDRWSAVEYAAHARDVLMNLRDRIILGVVEDNPVPHGMHGTPRIELGLYDAEQPESLANELVVVAEIFIRTYDHLPPHAGSRPIFYGWPVATTRTLDWVAAQALHECEHHLDDAKFDLAEIARLA